MKRVAVFFALLLSLSVCMADTRKIVTLTCESWETLPMQVTAAINQLATADTKIERDYKFTLDIQNAEAGTEIDGTVPPVVVPPVETNIVEEAAGKLQPNEVRWLTGRGPSYAKAKTILKLSDIKIEGTRCHFKSSPKIPWAKRGPKGVNAIGILIRRVDGKFIGGKCEWVVGSRGWFDCHKNTSNGYNGHTMPERGEKVWMAIGNPDSGSEISSIEETKWP